MFPAVRCCPLLRLPLHLPVGAQHFRGVGNPVAQVLAPELAWVQLQRLEFRTRTKTAEPPAVERADLIDQTDGFPVFVPVQIRTRLPLKQCPPCWRIRRPDWRSHRSRPERFYGLSFGAGHQEARHLCAAVARPVALPAWTDRSQPPDPIRADGRPS